MMTRAEINETVELMKAAGRINVPVPLSEWKEMKLASLKGDCWNCRQGSFALTEIQGIGWLCPGCVNDHNEEMQMAATVKGKVVEKAGKKTFKPSDTRPVSKKIGAKAKADRTVKALKANREKKK